MFLIATTHKLTLRPVLLEWNDALVGVPTGDPKYVVTTPNMMYVPQAPVGIVHVRLRADGRYGVADPIQWPQIYTDKFDYLCAVRRRVPERHRLSPLWWTPDPKDWHVIKGSMFTCLGLLKWERVVPLSNLVDELVESIDERRPIVDQRLAWLETAMRHARDRLRCFPCTFLDTMVQVRETQRYWLMARAFLDYHDKYLPAQVGTPRVTCNDIMGAFTLNPGIVQRFFCAGIPIWFIRSDVSILDSTQVRKVDQETKPSHLCMDHPTGVDHILFRGLTGEGHLAATARGGHTYYELCHAPLLAVDGDGTYATPQSQHEYRTSLVGPSTPPAGPSLADTVPQRVAKGTGKKKKGKQGPCELAFLALMTSSLILSSRSECSSQSSAWGQQVPRLRPSRHACCTPGLEGDHGCGKPGPTRTLALGILDSRTGTHVTPGD